MHTYQEHKTIISSFEKNGEYWQINVENYDKSKPLIIDPLIYSTYIGGSSEDWGKSISLDANGNAYIIGDTYSPNYDITQGAFQTTLAGYLNDVFVTKLNTDGTALIYSTFLGGNDYDYGTSISVDNIGNVYVTGYTSSTDFDVTPGAFQTIYGGGDCDIFVTKLNSNGSSLIYSTYLGGSKGDFGCGIAIDADGNAYVTGYTESNDYDVTPGAFQTTHSGIGAGEVIVTKIDTSGSSLIYSTYIGGNSREKGYSIAVDNNGNAYITGVVQSDNYDITNNAFQTNHEGGSYYYDIFVTEINSLGTELVYSTYIGVSGDEVGYGITIDNNDNIYITGYTSSTNYDITQGAFQTTNNGAKDAFVTKITATNGIDLTKYSSEFISIYP